MKKRFLIAVGCLPFWAMAQMGIGFKGGLNFANVTSAASINSSSQTGYMVGVFLAPNSKGVLTSRHEIIYSRQGYNFETNTQTGKVQLDYLILPQLMGINITRFVQLQLGAQIAFLLNAKADSTNSQGGNSGSFPSAMSYYNQFDYGFGAGVEIHPVLGLLVGARYNISLAKLYKDVQNGQAPSFSSVDARNNVVQIFAGWILGPKPSNKK